MCENCTTSWYNCAHCEAGYDDQKCTCEQGSHPEWVRCCDITKDENNIYLAPDNTFRYSANDEIIQYCPWCGNLLDINLIGE